MKRIAFLTALIVQAFILQSQSIKGYVFYNPENTPAEFANVVILNLPDSSLVKGVITYPGGQFTASGIKPGDYFLKATFVGYQDAGTTVSLNSGQQEVWADTLFLLQKSEMLEDVTVTGTYVRAQEMVDRTVYEMLPEIEKASTNGFDVLRKVPTVQVDFNNNVTLNGKSNFIIQVDGKQRDKEFLARISPGDIKSVEVIHNPSGRYEGNIEGVLNVILKEGARVGVSGMFGMQYKPFDKPTLGAMGSIDYGREKATFYVSGYSFIQNLNVSGNDYRKISLPEPGSITDSILDLTSNGDFSIRASSINAGVDYRFDDKNTLSINYTYKPFSNIMDLQNDGDILLGSQKVNEQGYTTGTSSSSGENNVSLFYRKKFKKPIQELTIESIYYNFKGEDDNDFSQYLYGPLGNVVLDSLIRNEFTINARDYINTRVDYVQPIGVDMRLEAGIQFFLQNMDYSYRTNNEEANNDFDYTELRNSAYASFYWKLKKFSLQSTVRLENSNININQDIKNNYITVLPSTNLMYKFNTKHSLKFTYNRRIVRPGLYNLNPFERLNNDFSINAGNPYLEPEYKDRVQLSYTMNIKKINFAPYIYHEFYSDQISTRTSLRFTNLSDNLTIYTSPENLLTGYEQGIGVNATLGFFNLNGSIFRGHFNAFSDSITQIAAEDYYSFRLNSFVAKSFFKEKVSVFSFINYNGPIVSGQTKTYNPLFWGLGFQHKVKNHTWGMFYFLPFSETIQFRKVITETPQVYSENTQLFDASYFIHVMYSYKFNKGKAIKKASRKAEVDSDTRGGGIGR